MFATNDVVMPNELSDLCRVCLLLPEEDDCLDLTTVYDEDDNLTYGDCFTICTQIDLSGGDNLPHNLCRSCGVELQMAYDFYKKVEDSKRTLEQYKQEIQQDSSKTEGGTTLQKDEVFATLADVTTTLSEPTQFGVPIVDKEDVVELSLADKDLINASISEEEYIAIQKNSESSEITDIVSQYGQITESVDNENTNNADDEHIGIEQVDDDNLVFEEHLDINDFHIIETLEDEEAETLQIKSEENMLPFDLIEMGSNGQYIFEEVEQTVDEVEQTVDEVEQTVDEVEQTVDEVEQTVNEVEQTIDEVEQTVDEVVQRADEVEQRVDKEQTQMQSQQQQQPQRVNNKKDSRKWQENVVAVANKNHIPIEADETKSNNDAIEYELLQSADELDVEADDKIPVPVMGQPRKRRIGAYTCEYCLKIYPNYSRMANHRRCHETDRPKYPCELCGRIYSTKQAMECHIRTEHDKTGFSCTVCNKVFAIRRSLEVHMRFHNGDFPYECNLCEKKFAQLCHLNTHKNVKHNNVRFACDFPNCGKFFTSSTSLRNHEYSHGAMPFECQYCQRGYPAKAKLKIHIKRKHGFDMSKEQLENMRKFHVMRSKVNLVQVMPVEPEIISPDNVIDSTKIDSLKYDDVEF